MKAILGKLYNSFKYSLSGICLAYKQESSIRIEALLLLPLIVISIWFAKDGQTLLLLLAPIFVIFALELLNTAIEAVCNMYTRSHHEQIRLAKDCGSAAVFVAIVWLIVTWLTLLMY